VFPSSWLGKLKNQLLFATHGGKFLWRDENIARLLGNPSKPVAVGFAKIAHILQSRIEIFLILDLRR
jgi:uncharacterized protein (DUF1330 family)